MANNLFDRLLSITGLKAPDSAGNYAKYSDDGLTGVERYLARQAEADAQQAAAEHTLTGVEKYLQMQAEAEGGHDPKASSAPLSGVEKYLVDHAADKPVTAPVIKKPASGVEKYLQQQEGKKKPVAAQKKPAAPKRAAKPKPKRVAKKAAPAKKASTKPAATKRAVAKPTSGRIDLSGDGMQCQAGTAKGGQCKRTTSLMKLQRTISKQKYQFTVCSQHHNDSFKPYKGLI